MKKIRPNDTLNQAIILLQTKKEQELNALKEHFNITYESLKPANLIKSAIKEFTTSPDLKNGIASAAIGMASGYLVKKILFRATKNPLKILAGMAIQTIATNLGAKNAGTIKAAGQKIFEEVSLRVADNKKEFAESEIYE